MCWQKLMAVCSPTQGMSISCANTMHDIFIWLIKIHCVSSYKSLNVTLSFSLLTEGTHQSNSKNDKSQKRDNTFLIWSDVLPQSSINSWSAPKGWTPPNAYSWYWSVSHIRLTCKYIWILGQSALSSTTESNSDRSAFKAQPLGLCKETSISAH
jgi:hypothetical protein